MYGFTTFFTTITHEVHTIQYSRDRRAYAHFFAPSFGLKKLVNLFILLVLTFLSDSTPREAAGALRLAAAFSAASFLDWVIGAEAAICAAVRFIKYVDRVEKLLVRFVRKEGERIHSYCSFKEASIVEGRYCARCSIDPFSLATGYQLELTKCTGDLTSDQLLTC